MAAHWTVRDSAFSRFSPKLAFFVAGESVEALVATDRRGYMKFKVSMKNQYFADAKYFFKKSTPMITQNASKDEIIGAMLFFALGIERLLKSILWEINPIFVFTDQSFKNMAPALYSDKLLPSHKQNKEFSKKPNADVLTFKRSLLRAKEFSAATNKHLNVLFALSNYRDNIAHLPLEKIDFEKAKKLLIDHYISVGSDYSNELNIPIEELIGDQPPGLELLAKTSLSETERDIKQKLLSHHQYWKRISEDPSKSDKISKLNKKYERMADQYGLVECPACGNTAEIFVEPNYDYSDGEVWIVGIFPTSMYCEYCGLALETPEELNFIMAHEKVSDIEEITIDDI